MHDVERAESRHHVGPQRSLGKVGASPTQCSVRTHQEAILAPNCRHSETQWTVDSLRAIVFCILESPEIKSEAQHEMGLKETFAAQSVAYSNT